MISTLDYELTAPQRMLVQKESLDQIRLKPCIHSQLVQYYLRESMYRSYNVLLAYVLPPRLCSSAKLEDSSSNGEFGR
jgi:hypothetical protein